MSYQGIKNDLITFYCGIGYYWVDALSFIQPILYWWTFGLSPNSTLKKVSQSVAFFFSLFFFLCVCSDCWVKVHNQILLTQSASQFRCSVISDSLHARPPCPSPTPRVYSNSCPLSWWCHATISPSVVPFSSCPQSFPASRSLQMSQLFESGSQSIGVPTSASVLPMNIQDWFPSGWTGWISLQSKGLSRVFSNTTVQKHQFFGAQLSL